jgi:flagellar motor switch protein FliM
MSQAATLMERKIAAGRPRVDPSVVTPERALQAAFARTSEKLMKMPSRMPACTDLRLSGAEIIETLPEQALLLLLDGPRDGLGLMAIAPAALSPLIEIMTLGRVADRAPPPRRPTRTDAAMVSGLVDAVLAECEVLLEGQDDLVWLGGFRFGAHLPDPRPLGLMLEAPAYRVLRMTLGFGPPAPVGADPRHGEIMLALPAVGRGQVSAPRADGDQPAPLASDSGPAPADAEWDRALERAILPVSGEVRAVLPRVTLTLAELMQVTAGVSLPLPQGSLRHVQIEGVDGRVITCGQLGQGNGRRVVRLTQLDVAQPLTLPVNPTELVPAHKQPMVATGSGDRRPTTADLTAPRAPLRPDSAAAIQPDMSPTLTEETVAKAG